MKKKGPGAFKETRDRRKGYWCRTATLAFWVRVILGSVFVYASIDKILHPAAFAEAVYNYQILPDALINLTAIILPWMEMILGLFLILGFWLPGAILLSNFLLVAFFGALVFNMARGLNVHCGCFNAGQEAGTEVSMAWYVIRDGVFVALALYLFSHIIRKKANDGKEQGGQFMIGESDR